MIIIRILLVCGNGVSTGMFARKLTREAQKRGVNDFETDAISYKMMSDFISKCDFLLIGPQMKFNEHRIASLCEKHKLPYLSLDPREFGEMKVEQTLETILKMVEEKNSEEQGMEKEKMENIESIAMILISKGGTGRSLAMDSIRYAKMGDFEKAYSLLTQSDQAILEGHDMHTKLLVEEANNRKLEFSILLVHALEHLMNAMTVRDLAEEFVAIYEERRKKGD